MDAAGRLKGKKNNKGMALVYVALTIVVLIAFVGIAVDIGYMYVAKGQLQNAADAAALAGARRLQERSVFANQTGARNEAWRFACQNKVMPAGTKVFLVESSNDCNAVPAALNNANNPEGDIVLGNWNPDRLPDRFLPADNIMPVNAVKVIARRTFDAPVQGVKIGSNPVDVFFGRVLSAVGLTRWSQMGARAEAIALRNAPPVVAFPICLPTCGTTTALTIVPPNLKPGTRFFLREQDGTPLIGWTSFFEKPTNEQNITDYIKGEKFPPNLCSSPPPVCLNTTQGIVNPALCAMRQMLRKNSATYNVNGVAIDGWKVILPILDNTTNPCPGGHAGCLTDPGNQPGDAFPVVQFTPVIVTEVVPQGNCPGDSFPVAPGKPGIVLVAEEQLSGPLLSSTIQCTGCSGVTGLFSNQVNLVK